MYKFVKLLWLLCAISGVFLKPLDDSIGDVNIGFKLRKRDTIQAIHKLAQSPKTLRKVTTIGILAGALKAEENMESNLARMAANFFKNLNNSTPEQNLERIREIEKVMARDRRSVKILNTALELTKKNETYEEYKQELRQSVKENEPLPDKSLLADNLPHKIETIKVDISDHISTMHSILADKGRETLKFLNDEERKEKDFTKKSKNKVKKVESEKKVEKKSEKIEVSTTLAPPLGPFNFPSFQYPGFFAIPSALTYIPFNYQEADFLTTLTRNRRQDNSKESKESENGNKLPEGSPELSSEENDGSPPGGIVGLIASLSGGEEGSDIGALIGALTGVITNLFGPGGLDIPSLLSTGTSLLAGLLGGDENFGKVLAGYLGTALEGLSGGGGADNNGLFIGNFVGALLASLSADPEDDDNPPKPDIFINNVITGFKQGIRKASDGEGGSMEQKPSGGSNIFGFISNIISSIVGGITSFILNASLGSASGSSQGVADLSGGSSAASSSSHPSSSPNPQK